MVDVSYVIENKLLAAWNILLSLYFRLCKRHDNHKAKIYIEDKEIGTQNIPLHKMINSQEKRQQK